MSRCTAAAVRRHWAPVSDEVELRIAWSSIAPHTVRSDEIFDDLVGRHRQPHRRYHGLRHVVWVLRHRASTGDGDPRLSQRLLRLRRRRGHRCGLFPRRRLRPAGRRQRGAQRAARRNPTACPRLGAAAVHPRRPAGQGHGRASRSTDISPKTSVRATPRRGSSGSCSMPTSPCSVPSQRPTPPTSVAFAVSTATSREPSGRPDGRRFSSGCWRGPRSTPRSRRPPGGTRGRGPTSSPSSPRSRGDVRERQDVRERG